MRFGKAVLLVGCLLLALPEVHAQILTGSIIGTVRDESGAVLPGANVSVSSPAYPAGPSDLVTDARGQYRFVTLPPGLYTLRVELAGFASYEETEMRVVVNGTTERIVGLRLSALSETITVSGVSPVIDTRKVGMSTTIDQETVEKIPTRRFGVFDQMKLTPGVVATNPVGEGNSGMSVFGTATTENTFQIDGVVFNSPGGGGAWAWPDGEAAEEIEVQALGASAEYAHAQGAVFNVVTKSGTNRLRASASAWFLPDRLVTKPIELPCGCDDGRTGFSQAQYVDLTAHAGGPIIRDRLWFFGGTVMNRKNSTQPGADPDLPPKYKLDRPIVKITWQPGVNSRFFAMYRDDPWNQPSSPTATQPIETLTENGGRDPQYGFEWNQVLSSTTNITGRVSGWVALNDYTRPQANSTTAAWHQDDATGVTFGGVQQAGTSQKGLHNTHVKLSHFAKDLLGGDHDLKFGFQTERGTTNDAFLYGGGANFYHSESPLPYLAEVRDPYVQGGKYNKQGIYAEDQFTWNRLTLMAGVRWDRMEAVSQDLSAIDLSLNETDRTVNGLGSLYTWKVPVARLGFNYKLTSDNRTILRGNYGRSYRSTLTNDYADVHPGVTPVLQRFFDASGAVTREVLSFDPSQFRVDPNTKAPYTDQYSIGFDRELLPSVAFQATYVHKEGHNLIGFTEVGGTYETRTVALPDGRPLVVQALVSPAASQVFLRTNPSQYFTKYDGMVFALQRRWSGRWQMGGSYTLSHARGNLATASAIGRDPNDFTNLEGDLPTDRRHMLSMQGAVQVPRVDVNVSAAYMLQSGLPYAPQAQVVLPQGRKSINTGAPGTFRFPKHNNLNLRVSKFFAYSASGRIELIADAQNLLQAETSLSVITRNFFSTNFGLPATWVEPRRLLLGIKFTY